MHCISDRLKLRGRRRVEPHVPDDNGGKRVDNAVGNGPREFIVNAYPELLLGGKTYAAKTEVKSKRAFGSKKPTRACFLSNALFLMPVSLSETRLTARSRWRWLRNQALEGESGRPNQTMKAQRQVTPPSYREVSVHPST